MSDHSRIGKSRNSTHKACAGYRLALIAAILIIGSIFLAACGTSGEQLHDVAAAVEAGIIMQMPLGDATDAEEAEVRIVQASVQDMAINTAIPATLVFPIYQMLFFESNEGYVTMLVEEGQLVREGDALAQLTFSADVKTRHEIAYDTARVRLRRLENELAEERGRRLAEIEEARRAVAYAPDGTAAQQAALNARQLEIRLEQFTRSSASMRDALRAEIAAMAHTIESETIIAPFDGMITAPANITGSISGNPRIMTLVDYNVFFYEFTLTPNPLVPSLYSVLGHGDIITLRATSRPTEDPDAPPLLEFPVRVVSEFWAAGQRANFVYWFKPVDMERLMADLREHDESNPMNVLRGKTIMAELEIITAPDAVTLPLAAIRLEGNRQFVLINTENGPGKRFVHATTRMDRYIHIVTGIEAGTEVILP
ncbi:MAG: hypothetical protein FWC96_04750 [Oscillospiraceae bacterium]|nr:hypothetical protein [Oscillospiraceae bacterium]